MNATLQFEREHNPALTNPVERAALLKDPGFGRVFTDHMATIRYTDGGGWHSPRIEPRAAITLNPASMVLHYAQEVFEGLKAYHMSDGGASLFRPDLNALRFRRSAERLAMAQLPEELFLASVRALVLADRDWIPEIDGGALYLRPFMIATEVALGVKPAAEYLYCVIASPVGSYFKSGAGPVSIWVTETFTRAAIGGTGEAKCGGNYAASLCAQAEASKHGCDQVMFLDAAQRRWIEELGGMNVFVVFADGSLQTPPLTGTILPGVTRTSLITLAHDMGLTVREEPYEIDQLQADAASGKLIEAFACGTAAVVTPIGRVRGINRDIAVGHGQIGETTKRLRDALVNIQRGEAADPHGWCERLF